ncbi:hypothetical protein CR51_36055 [Caballeronia megalochromosomata]|nr:hypothetical protein CR51_36055 [Caballeronia megalochromosomata]
MHSTRDFVGEHTFIVCIQTMADMFALTDVHCRAIFFIRAHQDVDAGPTRNLPQMLVAEKFFKRRIFPAIAPPHHEDSRNVGCAFRSENVEVYVQAIAVKTGQVRRIGRHIEGKSRSRLAGALLDSVLSVFCFVMVR